MPGDAFLDIIGTGSVPDAPARARRRPSPLASSVAEALSPVAAMLVVFLVVAGTGLSRRSGLPDAIEPYAFGFFLDRYPLAAFALVYGAARIVAVAAGRGPSGGLRRCVFGIAGVLVLAGASLYPTFGGLILRGGFAVGGMAFLNGMPMALAYTLGSGIAAAMFGGIVGVFGIAANQSLRPTLARSGRAAMAFLALWAGAGIIGLGHDVGFGPWPARAMTAGEAGLGGLLLALAAFPHVVLTLLGRPFPNR